MVDEGIEEGWHTMQDRRPLFTQSGDKIIEIPRIYVMYLLYGEPIP